MGSDTWKGAEWTVTSSLTGSKMPAVMADLWDHDWVQFARLLAEIKATGLTPEQMRDLKDSMDLESEEIHELLDRAESTFDAAKEGLMPQIYTALITHKHGVDVYTHSTRRGRDDAVYDFVTDWWDDEMGDTPLPESKGEAVRLYFEENESEFCDSEQYDLET